MTILANEPERTDCGKKARGIRSFGHGRRMETRSSQRYIKVFEALAGDLLLELGYNLSTKPSNFGRLSNWIAF